MKFGLKKIIPVAILSLTALTVAPVAPAAPAAPAASANPACAMVICLSADGGGVACQAAKKQFFKIVVKKHGKIKVGRTLKKRREKLESCQGSQASDRARIMARYGTVFR